MSTAPSKNTRELNCHITKETMERIESVMVENGCDLGRAVDILVEQASQVEDLVHGE